MNLLLICNDSNSTYNFRKELISFLLEKDYKIFLICSDEKREKEISALGVSFICVPFNNRSINILSNLKTYKKLKKQIDQINPDIVFTFQVKSNIFGSLAARKVGNKRIYSMVEGLGDPFQPKNIRGYLIRHSVCKLYKKAFKFVEKVFLLNNDDKNELINRNVLNPSKALVIPGIGINTKNYEYIEALPNSKNVTMMARLIKNKGIIDYCNIARETRKIRKDINFYLYGEESQLKVCDIQQYIDDGSILYGGYSLSPIEIIKNTKILVSSSYREGFPRVILESMAIGRPVIATNTVGSKDAVIDGKTGYLLPIHDIEGFSKKIIEIIDNDKLLLELGKNARQVCCEKYDSDIINDIIYKVISSD